MSRRFPKRHYGKLAQARKLLTRKRLAFLFIVLAIIVIVAIIAVVLSGGKAEAPEPGSTVAAGAGANVCGANPAPAAGGLQPTDFGFRQIASPAAGASVRSPLRMTGQANPFEGAYSITLLGPNGSQIAAMNYNKSNVALAFTADLPFSVTSPTPACVWYHERSGRDGSPVGITQIAVQLMP